VASTQRKLERFPVRRDVGETEADVRADRLIKPELVSSETLTRRLDLGDPAQERRRAIKVIAIVSITAGASLAALIYFVGVIAGAVALAAVGSLVAFGNWVLDNTIEIH